MYWSWWDVREKGWSLMGGVLMDFVGEKERWNIKNGYMLGKGFVVGGVVEGE